MLKKFRPENIKKKCKCAMKMYYQNATVLVNYEHRVCKCLATRMFVTLTGGEVNVIIDRMHGKKQQFNFEKTTERLGMRSSDRLLRS